MAVSLAGTPPGAAVLERLYGRGSVIFMLHRVLPEGAPCYDPEMAISVPLFDAFLRWVKERYQVVPLQRFASLQPEPAKRPMCALTFDDGWRDNFLHALPVLEEHGVPATIFLVVRFIGTERHFWQERLWAALGKFGSGLAGAEAVRKVVLEFPWCLPVPPQEASYDRFRRMLLNRPSSEAEAFVDRLEEQAGSRELLGERALLNWEEVRAMKSRGITFGSHTLNHCLLTRTAPRLAQSEIEESRNELKRHLGEDAAAFSYPWGSANPQHREQVREAGYQLAVLAGGGFVKAPVDPWRLPRVPVSDAILCSRTSEFSPQKLAVYLGARAVKRSAPRRAVATTNGHERIRIAFIASFIDAWIGGTEQQLFKLLSGLDRKYFDPRLCMLYPSYSLKPGDFPCPAHTLHLDRHMRFRPEFVPQLVRWLREQRPHVIQTVYPDAARYGTLAARWLGHAPIVETVRNMGHWQTPKDRLVETALRPLRHSWQCNSRAIGEWLRTSQGVPAEHIEILPNAIDLERYAPPSEEERRQARAVLNIPAEAPVLVLISNLRPVKDPTTAVEAARELRQALPDAKMILVGGGPLQAALEARIQQHQLQDFVRLASYQLDVRPYLLAADIGLFCSRSEGLPNTLLEYMAMGLPAVASDIVANREVMGGPFFAVGDAHDLAQKVTELWRNPEMRRRMRTENRALAENYSLEAFLRRAEAYYCRLVAGPV